MRIAITGGAGFVGGYLTTHFRAAGHEVTVLARRTPPGALPFIPFSLDAGLPPQRLEGFDALIHAAYDFSAPNRSNADSNVAGSVRLFKSAKAAGVARIVFISSLSAFDGCRSRYGAAKLAVERELAGIGGCAVRLGFVYDESGKGLSGALKRLALLPVVPMPGGGAQSLYTIHANDLGPAFLRILHQTGQGTFCLAHPKPVSLARMLRAFAGRQNNHPLFVPFPWRVLWIALRAAEDVRLNLKFRSDSLLSLMNPDPAPDFRWLRESGIALREFPCEEFPE